MNIPNLDRDPSGETWLLQTALNTIGYNLEADNWRGTKTEKALADFRKSLSGARIVKASSFADPADIAAFRRCKNEGHSDQHCFRFGDNGVGAWGHDTTGTIPMCALPREDWQEANKVGGSIVRVSFGSITVDCVLGDTMPRRANIKNGAGIDLNPAAVEAFGLRPPILKDGFSWEWA